MHPPQLVHPRQAAWKTVARVPRTFAPRHAGLPAARSAPPGGNLSFPSASSGSGLWQMLLVAFAVALVVVSLGAPAENWRRNR
jgi:hypothetical protein